MGTILDKFDLSGRTAVVTGGVGLLGKGFCRTLAEAGANVVVADLNEDKAAAYAEELKESGYLALGVGLDVTQPESNDAMVARAVEKFGRLDVVVCSAAMDPKFDASQAGQHNNSFEDYPLAAWQSALDVNLTGMFLSVQASVKPMVKQGKGSIILICSTYGLVGPDQRIYEKPGQPRQYKPIFYTVTKAGVLGMCKYLSTYYAGTDIRVNCLTPGGVYNSHDETFTRNYSYRAVMGRMANLDEMNGGLLFLASDASSYMTGSNLVIDGGWTAW
ncbi:MAG: SDR family oxidoreductase [Chloroflexi bacterium]|nr:SDR family oxidoreductase [Chloroflexota bacterium]